MGTTNMLPVISADRLARDLAALAEITSTPGRGITRLAFSPEDARARALMRDEMDRARLATRMDAAGNTIGRLHGVEDHGPVVMTGSHLDSVPNGGNFDGAAGVVAAIEAVRAINDAGIRTRLPIEVTMFAAEEAPRFSQSGHRFGSRVMAGLFDHADIHRLRDSAGTTLASALQSFGLDPDRIGDAQREPGTIRAFVELHIEQGLGLAEAGRQVGVVTCITGTTRYQVELAGRADHSGGTPMMARRDALAAGAEVVLAVERTAREIGAPLVATVGVLQVEPGSISTVPGRVVLGIDVRDIRDEPRCRAAKQILAAIDEVSERRQVARHVHLIRDDPPVQLSKALQETIEDVCAERGIACARVPSHTGHDASGISRIAETGMIFVRNVSGKSHSPDEHVRLDDIAAATQVLVGTLLRLAGRAI